MNYDPRFEETNGDAKLPYRKITRLISRHPTVSEQAAARQWDAATLRDLLSSSMAGEQIIVVSNRQPFTHVRVNGDVTMTAACKWAGDRTRASGARLQRYLDRARQWQR